jgi:hypothetical protein
VIALSPSESVLDQPQKGRVSRGHYIWGYLSQRDKPQPLRSHDEAINYIRATTTKSGLTIDAVIDKTTYEKGITVSKKAFHAVNITKHDFHGEWNYTISPQPTAELCRH